MWGTLLSFFTGSKLWMYLAAALALSVLMGWLFWSRQSLKTDLATANANVSILQGANRAKAKAIEDLQATYKATDAALAARTATLQNITAQRETLRTQLNEVYRHDQIARTWAEQPLPSAVRGILLPQTAH